jgi:hypothetical protein
MEPSAMPRIWCLIGIGVLVAAFPPAARSEELSTGPIPQYMSNVTSSGTIDMQSATIATTDKPELVARWFKANLPKGTFDAKSDDGAHMFYLPSGATVDVEPDGTGTMIGMAWQAR